MMASLYQKGNDWEKRCFKRMSDFNIRSGIKDFGVSQNRNPYYHLLTPKDSLHNFLGIEEIQNEVFSRFQTKAGDLNRTLTNTVSSQTCCFNLFAPIKNREYIKDTFFSLLLGKHIYVTDLIIEFTPTEEESLGDQTESAGTDSDVAVFYTDEEENRGVILIEFKYSEPEFSTCSSYNKSVKKEHIRPICSSNSFYKAFIDSKLNNDKRKSPLCGYLKYRNWQLLQKSTLFNLEQIKNSPACPFRFSLQQLWRNMLLAENVAKHRNLDEQHFWVIAPRENHYLWNNHQEDVLSAFANILSPKGKECFRTLELEDVYDKLMIATDPEDAEVAEWMYKFFERYIEATP